MSEAWVRPGRTTVTAGLVAPGCQDASCVLVVKLNSATRLSPWAGQPKPTRASLLTKVPGTAVSRPLAMDATSRRRASAPLSPELSTLTCSCLLYTSDAADDLLCVDLGGR